MKITTKLLSFIAVGVILGVSTSLSSLIAPVESLAGNKSTTIVAKQSYVSPTTIEEQPLERGNYISYIAPPEITPEMVASNDATAFTNNPAWDVQWPFPVGVHISSGYGSRVSPCEGCSSYHEGTDFAINEGTPVQPIARGTVIAVGWDGNYGYRVIIQHVINGQEVTSLYGHLVENSSPLQPGDKVRTGDLIGHVGNTGKSTGDHLHLEISMNGIKLDPETWLNQNAGKSTAS